MIARLTGQPQISDQQLILDVHGVGYGVAVSHKVLQQATRHDQLTLFIHTYVREDRIKLYGFLTQQELQLFKMVTDVSGIGPATALVIMEQEPEKLITAVQEADVSFFKSIPRIGKKTAQKIIIELRGKLGEMKELNLAPLSSKEQTVVEALTALGFDDDQARSAISLVDLEGLDDAEAIKAVIKQLGTWPNTTFYPALLMMKFS